MASIHIDDLERVPLSGKGGVAWLPVRAALRIASFVNAWTAEEAGTEVIGPHARREPDFDQIRDSAEFRDLIG